MKKVLSKLSVFVLLLSVMLGFGSETAFAAEEQNNPYVQVVDFYFQAWNQTDFQQSIDAGVAADEAVIEQFTRWQDIKNQIGDYEEDVETKVEEKEGTLVVTKVAKYTNSNLHFEIIFDKAVAEQYQDPSVAIMSMDAFIPTTASGETNMMRAGINTLVGMGIVFCALVFISLVIWLLKFVPVLLQGKKKKEKETVEVPASLPLPVAEVSETEDTELVAVITAAIMALRAEENKEGSGFVVRSIRRRR